MSLLKWLRKAFEPTEEWALEGQAEKYYSAKLLLEILNAKSSLDEGGTSNLDFDYINTRLRKALKLDKNIIKIAQGILIKDKTKIKVLEDAEDLVKRTRNLLAFFIRLERFESRGGDLQQKKAELQWASQEFQKLIENTRLLLEEEKR